MRGGWGRGQRDAGGQEKEELHLPELRGEIYPRRRPAPSPEPLPSDDVTEVTSRRLERGSGRKADRAGVVGLWRKQLGAGESVSGRAGGRASAGGGERRTARSSACPGRGGASAGGQPERAPGSPPPLVGAVPGVPQCGGRRRRLSGPHGTARVLPPRPRSRRGRGTLRAGPGARDRRAKEGREAAAAQATGRQRRRRQHVIPQSRQEADGHGRSQAVSFMKGNSDCVWGGWGCPDEGFGALQATGRASPPSPCAYGGPLAPPRSRGLFQVLFICSPPRCASLLALPAPPGARDFSSTTFGFLRRPFLGGWGG